MSYLRRRAEEEGVSDRLEQLVNLLKTRVRGSGKG
jgi:hypothetical protein